MTRTSNMSAEPHYTRGHEPEGNPEEPISEPVPMWSHARETWRWTWQLHWAGLGTLFFLVALHAMIHVVRIVGKGWKPRRLLALVVNCLLVLFGLTRALFLFVNPYESDDCHVIPTCPVILTRILFGIGLPCLTASFSLIHLAFLQVTKLKLYPAKLQSGKFISSVIVFNFTLAIVTEVLISLHTEGRAFSIACQSFFILMSFSLSTSYIYSGTKILAYVKRSNSQMQSLGELSIGPRRIPRGGSNTQASRPYRPNVTKLVKITYISVFLGFASCALQLYSIFHVYNMYSGKYKTPEPWPWLVFQSLCRFVELAAGCTMAYVSPRQVKSAAIKLSCFSRKTPDYCTSSTRGNIARSQTTVSLKIEELQQNEVRPNDPAAQPATRVEAGDIACAEDTEVFTLDTTL